MAPNFYSVILSCLPVVGKHGNQKKHGLHSAGVRSAKFCPWTVARRPCHQLCSHHASGANNIWDLLQKIGWNQGHIWDHLAVARCILYLSIQPKLPHDLLKIFPLFKLAKLIHTVLQTQKEQLSLERAFGARLWYSCATCGLPLNSAWRGSSASGRWQQLRIYLVNQG